MVTFNGNILNIYIIFCFDICWWMGGVKAKQRLKRLIWYQVSLDFKCNLRRKRKSGLPVWSRLAATGLLAARMLRLLVVYGEVEERDLRRAGMSGQGSPSGVSADVLVVITANTQVTGQRDLQLKPHLSVLRKHQYHQKQWLITFLNVWIQTLGEDQEQKGHLNDTRVFSIYP